MSPEFLSRRHFFPPRYCGSFLVECVVLIDAGVTCLLACWLVGLRNVVSVVRLPYKIDERSEVNGWKEAFVQIVDEVLDRCLLAMPVMFVMLVML